jgi:hypothetical protein
METDLIPLYPELGGPEGGALKGFRKSLTHLGSKPRSVQPVANRSTDYAILAANKENTFVNYS